MPPIEQTPESTTGTTAGAVTAMPPSPPEPPATKTLEPAHWKYLLILRRFLLDLAPEPLRQTIFFLSHAGSHPNIFWTKDNWIKPDAEQRLLPSFRWSPEELAQMLRAVPHEDYGKGTLGKCLDVLLYEDPAILRKLNLVIPLLLRDPDTTWAVRAATLALTHSHSQRSELRRLMKAHRRCWGTNGSKKSRSQSESTASSPCIEIIGAVASASRLRWSTRAYPRWATKFAFAPSTRRS